MQSEYQNLKDILQELNAENLTNEDIDNIVNASLELINNASQKSKKQLFHVLKSMMQDLETKNYTLYQEIEKSLNTKIKQNNSPKSSM
jgi:nitrogen fixation/metabolism regulation signal transduction histidine kinase